MTITKSEFFTAASNVLQEQDATAILLKVQDPRLVQPIGAMAQMLAMLSQQIDVASNEPFDKVRDATIYADAALKGIMPYARSGTVTIVALNDGVEELSIAAGRELIDQKGRVYRVLSGVTLPAASAGVSSQTAIRLTQIEYSTVNTSVSESSAFMAVNVPKPTDEDVFLTGIDVYVNDVLFAYNRDFTNVLPDDKIYHVEIDEYQNINVKFGYRDVVGYQPFVGDVIRIETTQSYGEIDGKAGDEFSLSSALTSEGHLIFKLSAVEDIGADPINLSTLRELCRYPSVYSENAVYLGSFDALIRRHHPDLRFLSVWNEQIEEGVRGADIDNINRLFVSFVAPDGVSAGEMEDKIRRLIKKADDGYRVSIVAPTQLSPVVLISAKVSVSHDAAVVTEQVRSVLLSVYGAETANAKRGMLDIRHKDIVSLLLSKVTALSDRVSDFTVSVSLLGAALPEQWRYLSEASIQISVTAALSNDDKWGA